MDYHLQQKAMKEPKNIKSKYGKDSEAANAHIQTLISPPNNY